MLLAARGRELTRVLSGFRGFFSPGSGCLVLDLGGFSSLMSSSPSLVLWCVLFVFNLITNERETAVRELN